jgi:hypothetical protein
MISLLDLYCIITSPILHPDPNQYEHTIPTQINYRVVELRPRIGGRADSTAR